MLPKTSLSAPLLKIATFSCSFPWQRPWWLYGLAAWCWERRVFRAFLLCPTDDLWQSLHGKETIFEEGSGSPWRDITWYRDVTHVLLFKMPVRECPWLLLWSRIFSKNQQRRNGVWYSDNTFSFSGGIDMYSRRIIHRLSPHTENGGRR